MMRRRASSRVTRARPHRWTLEEMGAGMSSTFVDELPGDPVKNDPTPREVRGALHSMVQPTPSGAAPELVMVSPEVEALLHLMPSELEDNPLAAEYLSGNARLPGATKPYAQNYGGHQFGQWAGQLGDGRAITLGEVVVTPAGSDGEGDDEEGKWSYDDEVNTTTTRINGHTARGFELQLKGAGKTPYSRNGDGRAVLRSSLREFIASEAMHHLGVPTARCLSLTLTGAGVLRDAYNVNAWKMEAGAVVSRVAPSFIRFGTFQLPPSRGDAEGEKLSAHLADYVVRHHMPDVDDARGMLRRTVAATAATVAGWQAVGFTHGVLNTDNMSILGGAAHVKPDRFTS